MIFLGDWQHALESESEKKRDSKKGIFLEEKRREKSRKGGRLEARLPRYVSSYFWCSYSYWLVWTERATNCCVEIRSLSVGYVHHSVNVIEPA